MQLIDKKGSITFTTSRLLPIIILISYYKVIFIGLAGGDSIIVIAILAILHFNKASSSQNNKPDEKGSEHIQMMTKDCDGWKYKKLEDADGDDSGDSTTTDDHKKLLN